MSMMIHRDVLRMSEAERNRVEEKPVEEKKAPVEEKVAEKPSSPKRGGRKPKR